jgi:hypothetical protein
VLQIIPISEAFLTQVRQRGVDDLGQPVERLVASGGEPCRDVFRRARPGEALILGSYCPFERVGPYREYGPVFVLADGEVPAPPASLPVDGASPYLGASFVLRAYSPDERIVDAVLSSPAQASADLARLFGQHAPAFVLARFPTYGCYALRIESRERR